MLYSHYNINNNPHTQSWFPLNMNKIYETKEDKFDLSTFLKALEKIFDLSRCSKRYRKKIIHSFSHIQILKTLLLLHQEDIPVHKDHMIYQVFTVINKIHQLQSIILQTNSEKKYYQPVIIKDKTAFTFPKNSS